MKILQLCTKVPFPVKDGGAIVAYSFSEAYHLSGNNVRILAVNPTKHFVDTQFKPNPHRIIIEAVPVNTRVTLWGAWVNLFFSNLPYQVSRFKSKFFERKLIEILHEFEPDIVQFEGINLFVYAPIIRKQSQAKLVLRCHNIEHLLWNDIIEIQSNVLKKKYLGYQNKRLKKFEINSCNNSDGVTFISNDDFNRLSKLITNKNCNYIPFGFNQKSELNHNFNKIEYFYIGALDWIPNQHAIDWFISDVWLPFYSINRNCTLHIAGRNAPNKLESKLKNTEGVIFYGEIEHADLFFSKFNVLVVPLSAGSGIRVKIMEAMHYGTLVICSSKAIAGINALPFIHYLPAETSQDFIKILSEVEQLKFNMEEIVKNSKILIDNQYTMSGIIDNLMRFYNTLL